MTKSKRWSRHFDACLECKRTDRNHKASGYCGTCYRNMYFQTYPEKKAVQIANQKQWRLNLSVERLAQINERRRNNANTRQQTIDSSIFYNYRHNGTIPIGSRVIYRLGFGACLSATVRDRGHRFGLPVADDFGDDLTIEFDQLVAVRFRDLTKILNQSAWHEMDEQARRWATNKLLEVTA